MSASGDREWTPKAPPMSMVAMNFASDLDDLFNLGAVGELKDSVDQRSRELADLDAQLRRADDQLKRLDTRYKRMSRQFPGRYADLADLFASEYANSSSSDTDEINSPREADADGNADAHRDSLRRLEGIDEQAQDESSAGRQSREEGEDNSNDFNKQANLSGRRL